MFFLDFFDASELLIGSLLTCKTMAVAENSFSLEKTWFQKLQEWTRICVFRLHPLYFYIK